MCLVKLYHLSQYEAMSSTKPNSELMDTRWLAASPLRVSIRITPEAAPAPYRAVAVGPLMTCTLAMSAGFRSSRRDTVRPSVQSMDSGPKSVWLLVRMPSIMTIGFAPWVRLVTPLTRIRDAVPTGPEPICTSTPAALPLRRSDTLATAALSTSAAASNRSMSVPNSIRLAATASTETTISSRSMATDAIAKSAVVASSAVTVIDCSTEEYPICSARRTCSPKGRFSRKRPS